MKLHTRLLSPDDGSPTGPAGHAAGSGGGERVGSSPKDVFGDSETPQVHQSERAAPSIPTKKSGITEGVRTEAPVTAPVQTQTQRQQVEAPTAPVTAAAPSVAMTEEQLQRLAASMRPAQAKQPTEAQLEQRREMTPEERADFDKKFHIVRVTPDMFKGIMGFAPESQEQVMALENFAHSIMRMSAATTLYEAQRIMQERETLVRNEFGPIRETYQKQQDAQLESELFAAHPDLSDFRPLLVEITTAAKANGIRFNSKEEAYTFVANKARALLGKGAPASSTQGRETVRKPAMPTTSMGGRSASPQSSPQLAASGPRAVFGDMDTER